MKMELRAATERDKAFLRELNRDAYQDIVAEQFGEWDDEVQAQNFEKKWQAQNYQIIESDGRAIGAIWVSEESDHFWLREIQISSTYRDQGIGTAILRELMEDARIAGSYLRLRVLTANRAKALYERLGFRTTGMHDDTHYWMVYTPERPST